jgi:hypothetical protein
MKIDCKCRKARVCMRVFSTLMARWNKNRSGIRVDESDWILALDAKLSSKFENNL